jgi:hypothetical protein
VTILALAAPTLAVILPIVALLLLPAHGTVHSASSDVSAQEVTK